MAKAKTEGGQASAKWVLAKIGDIKRNPKNPRTIKDHKFKQLVKSIIEFPEMLRLRPIVVNSQMMVLGGNMRLSACIEAGLKEVPVIVADELTEAQQREFIIKDNVSFGEWDWAAIGEGWGVEVVGKWGLERGEWETPPTTAKAQEDLFEVPDGDIETDIVLGDIITIGHHRLMCGDSTDAVQVKRLMDGTKADMAHNDPPYGMGKESEGVINDNLNYSALLDFNRSWILLQFQQLKENGSWYCWGTDEPLMDIYSCILKPLIAAQQATFRNLITWDKAHGQGQNTEQMRSFATADEKCLFVMCGVQGFNTNADNYFEGWETIRTYLVEESKKMGWNAQKIIEITGKSTATHYFSKSQWMLPTEEHYNAIRDAAHGNAFKREYDEIKREYYSTRAYFDNTHDNMNNVWHFDRHQKDGSEGNHATPKPIPLCARAIMSSCPEGGIVLDMFLGSGSTIVAAHQIGRKCWGMELSPKYCQVIVNRMIALDPSLEIIKNGMPYVKD